MVFVQLVTSLHTSSKRQRGSWWSHEFSKKYLFEQTTLGTNKKNIRLSIVRETAGTFDDHNRSKSSHMTQSIKGRSLNIMGITQCIKSCEHLLS